MQCNEPPTPPEISAASLQRGLASGKFILCHDGSAMRYIHDCKEFAVRDPQNLKVFVNVGLVDRAYGGPEEGGWWYDTYEHIESVQCWLSDAQRVMERLKRKYSNEGRRPISSVLSEGEYHIHLSHEKSESSPATKPVYC